MLSQIISHKRKELELKRKEQPLEVLMNNISTSGSSGRFSAALMQDGFSLIAEIKQKSPSKGMLRKGFDPLGLADSYQRAGASAISILADSCFFGGGAHIIEKVVHSGAVSLPILYKEFIISEYQLYEARKVGASAILIIVRILNDEEITAFIKLAEQLGLDALVETFTLSDVDRALKCGAKIIGVNNRDLDTFKTNFKKTKSLVGTIPSEIITVSESGINSSDDIKLMSDMGFDAALVGEAILTHQNVEKRIADLLKYV